MYVVVERNISCKWCRRINLSSADDVTFDWPKQSLVKPMCRDSRWVRVTTSSLLLQRMTISISTASWERNNVKPLQPISISTVDGTFWALQCKTSTTNSLLSSLKHTWGDITTLQPISLYHVETLQHKTSTTNIPLSCWDMWSLNNQYPFVTLRYYNTRPQ